MTEEELQRLAQAEQTSWVEYRQGPRTIEPPETKETESNVVPPTPARDTHLGFWNRLFNLRRMAEKKTDER
jgi:hypothetical protein